MTEREFRSIQMDPGTGSLKDLLSVSPLECWQAWVLKIANDPEMDLDRIIDHVSEHASKHMPNKDAPAEQWADWMAGCYNLLAILGHMVGCNPSYVTGVDLLFRKWVSAPIDHTPPPQETVKPTKTEDKKSHAERYWRDNAS